MKILGIDPGKSGALVFIETDESNPVATTYRMPLAGKDIDAVEICHLIEEHQPDRAYMEKVHAMPGQGVTSMFTFGTGYGLMIGIMAALKLPLSLVTPQAWKKVVLSGTSKDKAAAIAFCRREYPSAILIPPRCRKPHDGIADALCIGHFGLVQWNQT